MKCLLITVLVAAVLIAGTEAETSLDVSYVFASSTATVTLKVIPTSTTVTMVAIWNKVDGTYNCRTDIANSIALVNTDEVHVFITPTEFQDANQANINCAYEYTAGVTYRFYVRTFTTNPENPDGDDKEFEVAISSPGSGSTILQGTTTFKLADNHPETTDLTTASISTTLEVVDSSDAVVTAMDLGQAARLKFTMVVNPYETSISLDGARLTTCVVDELSDYSQPVTLINGNGCFQNSDIFEHTRVDRGFSKTSSQMTSGAKHTYIATSNAFEMSGFYHADLTTPSPLYFKCSVTYCFDDTVTGDGTCGALHCDPNARRKREVRHNQHIRANVTILPRKDAKQKQATCERCTESDLFVMTGATLSTIVAVLFAGTAFVYRSLSGDVMKQRKKRSREFAFREQSVPSVITGGEKLLGVDNLGIELSQ